MFCKIKLNIVNNRLHVKILLGKFKQLNNQDVK